MKSQRRTGPANRSKFQSEVILSVEEAIAVSDCEPVALDHLNTFLTHMGVKRAQKIEKVEKKATSEDSSSGSSNVKE